MGFDFKLNDDNVLNLSSIGVGALGLASLVVPQQCQEVCLEKTTAKSDIHTRWHGHALTAVSASGLISATSDDKKFKKNMLKLHALGWGSCMAFRLYSTYGPDKAMRQDFTNAILPIEATMTAICAWRGFKDEDED